MCRYYEHLKNVSWNVEKKKANKNKNESKRKKKQVNDIKEDIDEEKLDFSLFNLLQVEDLSFNQPYIKSTKWKTLY